MLTGADVQRSVNNLGCMRLPVPCSPQVDTWDVVKQRPGPAWTLSQWCTYWHARLEAATRQAKPATAHGAPGMLINDDDDEEGEVVDSGVVIVLQGVQG